MILVTHFACCHQYKGYWRSCPLGWSYFTVMPGLNLRAGGAHAPEFTVLETVKAVQSNKAKLESFLSGGADVTAEDAKAAYEYLEGVDSNMKKFDSIEIAISFPVRRIARLNELTTIDIVKEYGIALSRIGHPFDFSGEISAFE